MAPETAGKKLWSNVFQKKYIFNERLNFIQMGTFQKGAGFLREGPIFFLKINS